MLTTLAAPSSCDSVWSRTALAALSGDRIGAVHIAPHGPPSLREATSFTVRGDVTFDDPGLVIRGDVVIEA